jgi:hypothetical protein
MPAAISKASRRVTEAGALPSWVTAMAPGPVASVGLQS